jgi:hypothetical protein
LAHGFGSQADHVEAADQVHCDGFAEQGQCEWAPFLPTVFSAGAMPAQLTKPISLPSDTALSTTACAIGFIADIAVHKGSTNLLGDGFAFVDLHVRDDDSAALRKASMRAVPSPRPEAPPVTMNTLPLMSMCCSNE